MCVFVVSYEFARDRMEGSLCTWLTLSCQQSLGQLTGKRGRQAESDFAVLQIPPSPPLFICFASPSTFFLPSCHSVLQLKLLFHSFPFHDPLPPPPTPQNYPSISHFTFLSLSL